MPRITLTAAVAALAASAILLAGCASPQDGPLRLVDTKSPVQLLRNEAVDRVDPDVVDNVIKAGDTSFPCVTEDGNAEGLVRQWKSSTDLAIVAGTDQRQVAEALVASFTEQGWSASVAESSGLEVTTLTSDTSVATIEVSAADESTNGLVRVVALGPCVVTEGPDSAEVRSLG